MMTVACAGAAVTAVKCIARGTATSLFGIGAAYFAAAALSGIAAGIYGDLALTNFTTYRNTALDTIDRRKDTENIS